VWRTVLFRTKRRVLLLEMQKIAGLPVIIIAMLAKANSYLYKKQTKQPAS